MVNALPSLKQSHRAWSTRVAFLRHFPQGSAASRHGHAAVTGAGKITRSINDFSEHHCEQSFHAIFHGLDVGLQNKIGILRLLEHHVFARKLIHLSSGGFGVQSLWIAT